MIDNLIEALPVLLILFYGMLAILVAGALSVPVIKFMIEVNMPKYNVGDYIQYTPDQEQQVIDKLLSEGEDLYSTELEGYEYCRFLKHYSGTWLRAESWNALLTTDITESFFADDNLIQQLPEKWYLDCGDRMEVRQWLKDLGYDWYSGGDLTKNYLQAKCIGHVDSGMARNPNVDYFIEKGCTKITPTFSTKTIEVDYVSGFTIEDNHNKDADKLADIKAAYKALGEMIKGLENDN